MKKLATCQWLHEHLNVLITRPSGIGKSSLAYVLALPGRVAKASPPATSVYHAWSPSSPSPAVMVATASSWGLRSAEAVLKLRSLHSSGDTEAYWTFHKAQEQERNHRSRMASHLFEEAA